MDHEHGVEGRDGSHEEMHTHDHPHSAGRDHGQAHNHGHRRRGWLRDLLPFGHGHSHDGAFIDPALESSERGIWALQVSLVGLGLTALFQLVIVAISGSVALLADTIHNFSDAFTAAPLWIAFALSRRGASRRYTYGYGRAEDLAGMIIVLVILLSGVIAAYESYQKLAHPRPLNNIGWVMVASIVGFIGNEAVAQFRIRIGREIGSAALVADGQHSRVDGFTSLAVLFGALGVLAGYPMADPIVGLVITVAILFIVKDTIVVMWRRLMDAVDPEITDGICRTAASVPAVVDVHDVRVRWLGHSLQAELHVTVDEDLPTRESHRIVEEVRHALFHAQQKVARVNVHVDPCGHSGHNPHVLTTHHDHPQTAATTTRDAGDLLTDRHP